VNLYSSRVQIRTGLMAYKNMKLGTVLTIYSLKIIGVASYGALGHVPPPRLPASYFGDHSLYRLTSHAHGFYRYML